MTAEVAGGSSSAAGRIAGREDSWWVTVLGALVAMNRRQAAAAPGARVIDIPGVVGIVGPRSWVYVHSPVDPAPLVACLDAVHPAALVLLSTAVSPAVDGALEAAGWSTRRPLDLMAAVDVRAPAAVGHMSVEVVAVENVTSAQQVCDAAFGAPGDLSSWVRAVDCGGLLARDDAGRPIAVAGWQKAGAGARIENVATVADRRGEGLGAAMSARAVAAARSAGAAFVFLEATEAGAPVYRRIGFEHIARWRVHHRATAPIDG